MGKKWMAPVPDTEVFLQCFPVKLRSLAESTRKLSHCSSLLFNKPASQPLKHFVSILHLIAFE